MPHPWLPLLNPANIRKLHRARRPLLRAASAAAVRTYSVVGFDSQYREASSREEPKVCGLSPLEEVGFELPVPRAQASVSEIWLCASDTQTQRRPATLCSAAPASLMEHIRSARKRPRSAKDTRSCS